MGAVPAPNVTSVGEHASETFQTTGHAEKLGATGTSGDTMLLPR